jgi:hypothetical protein
MNISLRKAKAIQESILQAILDIDIQTHININQFQDPASELQRANDNLFTNDARRQKLLLAYYNVRGLVGTANAGCGITTNLAKSAFIDKRIAQLTQISNLKQMMPMNEITGKLENIKSRDVKESMFNRDEVQTSVVSQDQIDQAKAEIKNLKKQKQQLSDDTLELNIKTEIPLSDDVVQTLQSESII